METRIFGKTGAKVSIITLGGCGPGYVDQDEADKAIKLAMNNGVNIIDVAPTYGEAEKRLNPWIRNYRKDFFLAEKTLKRKAKSALRELNKSLEQLGTDYFDLYQFHAISSIDELNAILGENGAMKTFKEAKSSGKIRNIGITGHSDMRVLKRAIEMSDNFDTVLLPVYLGALINPDPVNDFSTILKIATEKNMGVTAIKSICRGRWNGEPIYNTWYEPLDAQGFIDQAVWFTLSQKGVSTYSLPCDIRLWPLIFDAIKRFRVVGKNELEDILTTAKKNSYKPLFPE
jgi:predicted aldo/keto reductase-like oxidoreductase